MVAREVEFDPRNYTSWELVKIQAKIDEELLQREAEQEEAEKQGLDEYNATY